ncbi:MAG: hypothetical protein V3T30_01335 [Thermodesulfobacteriota bacterium]
MSDKERSVGELFSRVYLERGAPQNDSERFRRRLGGYYLNLTGIHGMSWIIGNRLVSTLGVGIPSSCTASDIKRFFYKGELRDVLDSITLIWISCIKSIEFETRENASIWKSSVEQIFVEENLGYRLDEECGVHFAVDEEFERNRLAALSCLAEPKYAAVLAAFEKSHSKLDRDPPETKEAIRAAFEALEILYKLMTNSKGKSRLNSRGVQEKLKPIVQEKYKNDPTAITAVEHMLNGLCDWIEAGHMYRHGQNTEEPNDPPIGLAVQMVSSGASYLRWLVELNS